MTSTGFNLVFLLSAGCLGALVVGKSVGETDDKKQQSCPSRCNLNHGFCAEGTCKCWPGWQGPDCDQCVPATGCQHGTCQDKWQCNCEPGWAGLNCSIDMEYCERNRPCMNGGTCENQFSVPHNYSGYVCYCPAGFTGKTCAVSTTPVPPTTATTTTATTSRVPVPAHALPVVRAHRNRFRCFNGGTCVAEDASSGCVSCLCPAGFTGDLCQSAAVKHCATRPCSNGGRCIDTAGPVGAAGAHFVCDCQRGFIGERCENDTDECAVLGAGACGARGRCVNLFGGYDCACERGFRVVVRGTSKRCERRRDAVVATARVTTTTAAPKAAFVARRPAPSYKVTHIRQSVVEVENLLIPAGAGGAEAGDENNVSVVQAVTFAFLGIAVALFAGIGIFVWLHCGAGRKGAADDDDAAHRQIVCCGVREFASAPSGAEAERRDRRRSAILTTGAVDDDELAKSCNRESAVFVDRGRRQRDSGYCGAGVAMTSSEPPAPKPVDCLYVKLPLQPSDDVAPTGDESGRRAFVDVRRLSSGAALDCYAPRIV